jgi:hypothetical protein
VILNLVYRKVPSGSTRLQLRSGSKGGARNELQYKSTRGCGKKINNRDAPSTECCLRHN